MKRKKERKKGLPRKAQVRELITTRWVLQEILKRPLHLEAKG
jgi:hypothetical protein